MKNKINDLDVSGGVSFKDISDEIKKAVGVMVLVGAGIVAEKNFHLKNKLDEWANSK